MIEPFPALASRPAPPLDSMLLAIGREFDRRVDVQGARSTLEGLARELHRDPAAHDDAERQAGAIALVLGAHRFRPARRVSPADALLHRVLARREGHPLLLAALCAEFGARAGLDARPAVHGDSAFVVVRCEGTSSTESPRPARRSATYALVDPGGAGPPRKCPLTPMCAHEVAYSALTQLARLLALHGCVGDAIRAAELRAVLPVAERLQRRIEFETGALRAQLN